MATFEEAAADITPPLESVGGYIPLRTVPVGVGDQDPTGTFTDQTTPDDTAAKKLALAAARYVIERVGAVPTELVDAAKDAAAMRTAGLIELAYPVRDDDVNTGREWIKQADAAIAGLLASAGAGGSDPSALLPQYEFPDPDPCFAARIL